MLHLILIIVLGVLLFAAAVAGVVLFSKMQGRINALLKALSELATNHAKLKERFETMDGVFSKASELIEAAKEREEEAARSEKLFQDGINAIVNYDYMDAIRKKNGNG